MEKTGKNPFLIAMGALAAVAVVAFIILVLPAKGEATKKETAISKTVGNISRELPTLPGDPNVETWSKNVEDLKKRYRDRLADLQQYDQALGEWFEGLDDNTTYAVFMNTYDDQRGKLQEELLEKGVLLGAPSQGVETGQPGFNWVQRDDIERGFRSDEERYQAKEMLQKRFNLCRAIVTAVTSGYVRNPDRPRRLLDVTFLERFKFLPAGAPINPEGVKTFDIVIEPKRYAGYSPIGTSAFTEQWLPQNGDEPLVAEVSEEGAAKPPDAPAAAKSPTEKLPLGRTITFGFAVVMEYQHVPEVIHRLIDPRVDPKLNISIVGLNVFVPTPNPAEKKETKILQQGQTEAEVKAEAERRSEATPPPLVHMYVTCQVFDLDPSAVPVFLRP